MTDIVLRIHNPVAATVPAYSVDRLIPVTPRNVARNTVNENPVASRSLARTDVTTFKAGVVLSSPPPPLLLSALAKDADDDDEDSVVKENLL